MRLFVYTSVRKVKSGYAVIQMTPHPKGLEVEIFPALDRDIAIEVSEEMHRKKANILIVFNKMIGGD